MVSEESGSPNTNPSLVSWQLVDQTFLSVFTLVLVDQCPSFYLAGEKNVQSQELKELGIGTLLNPPDRGLAGL